MSLVKYFKKMNLSIKNMKAEKKQKEELLRKSYYEKERNKEIWNNISATVNLFSLRGELNLFDMKLNEVKADWYFDDEISLIRIPSKEKVYKKDYEYFKTMPEYIRLDGEELKDSMGNLYKEKDTGFYVFKIVNKTKNKEYASITSHSLLIPSSDSADEKSSLIIHYLNEGMKRNYKMGLELIEEYKNDYKLWSKFVKSLNLEKAKKSIDSDLSFSDIKLNSILPGKMYLNKNKRAPHSITDHTIYYESSALNKKILATRNDGYTSGDAYDHIHNDVNPTIEEVLLGKPYQLNDKKNMLEELKALEKLDEKLENAYQQSFKFYEKQLKEHLARNKSMTL